MTRRQRAMIATVINTGQNNWQPRPQSGLTREWVHGSLQGMDYPKRGEGRWVLLALVVMCVAGTLVAAAIP